MRRKTRELFPGDPDEPTDRARWPINDLGAARRLIAIAPGAARCVNRLGWAVWDGRRFDLERGEALALRLASRLQEAVLEESRAVARAAPTPEEVAVAALKAEKEGDKGGGGGGGEDGDDAQDASQDPEALAKAALRGQAGRLKRWAGQLGDAGRLRSALAMAAVQPEVMADPIDMDAQATVITVADGRLDLGALPAASAEAVEPEELSAALSAFSPADLSTRATRAKWSPMASAPKWMATLALFVPDPDERSYLKRCVGYALQGGQAEQVVFCWQGRGANGKSTVLDALAYALGDYVATAPVETFLKEQRGSSGHTTDLIRLIGARLVRVSEPEPGAVLSDSRIKAWTGGETLPVRELREKGFEARFDGTLFFSTNGTPTIHGADDGFWRRFHVMPWREQLMPGDARRRPKAAVDAELRAEADGILAWAVDGWREYAERGLDPPATIRAEADELRAAIDSLGQVLSLAFDFGPNFSESFKTIYSVVKGWHEAGGMRAPSSKSLALRLRERGFAASTEGREKQSVRLGLRLKPIENRPPEVDAWLPK